MQILRQLKGHHNFVNTLVFSQTENTHGSQQGNFDFFLSVHKFSLLVWPAYVKVGLYIVIKYAYCLLVVSTKFQYFTYWDDLEDKAVEWKAGILILALPQVFWVRLGTSLMLQSQ